MNSEINIIGTGGHSKVIADLAIINNYITLNYYDKDSNKWNDNLKIFPLNNLHFGESIVAIGSNEQRKNVVIDKRDLIWKCLIHPSAIIGSNVTIGNGTVVMAGAIIQSSTIIGQHCIINTGACIDHDCIIEDFVHIGPNSSIAGGVTIKEGTFIGIGSTLINNITVDERCIIGAGSVVINSLQNNIVVVGNPAKFLKFNK